MGLNVHQKAAAYDKALVAIIALQKANPSDEGIQNWVNENFPELKESKESEDERIRKYLITYFTNIDDCASSIKGKDVITWLEKQGDVNALIQEASEKSYTEGMRTERKRWLEKQGEHLEYYDDEDILQRFSFYSYKDEPNIIYLSGLYVNAKHRNKGIGTKILTIADEVAVSMGCNVIRLQTEIGSNAERLYRRKGYDTFKREGNQVWLEKQAEENNQMIDKPVYDTGDFVIDGQGIIMKIVNVMYAYEPSYRCIVIGTDEEVFDYPCKQIEESSHLWTIQDARIGDVLVHNDCTFIFMGIENGVVNALEDNFLDCRNPAFYGEPDKDDDYHPATKEQRDILFRKMREAGYQWDPETKGLKKVPKFHEGEWVVCDVTGSTCQIKGCVENISNHKFGYFVDSGYINSDVAKHYHLWTIQDAKDGDVLASKDGGDILIFRNLYTNISFSSYYNITRKGELGWSNSRFIPATKKQRDLLFQKLKEEGYEWDAEKKELKKIPIC